MITIVFGPMASGKTFHKKAFASRFGCTHIVEDWEPAIHEVPADKRLVLTNHHPDAIKTAIRLDCPDAQVRVIDIKTARHLIGVDPYAPGREGRVSI